MTFQVTSSAFAARTTPPLTLGLLTPHNPFDRTAFSGTAFFAARALHTNPDIRLQILGGHRPPNAIDRLRARIGQGRAFVDPHTVTFAGLDAVIGLVATSLLDRLLPRIPVPFFHATDATPDFLRQAYGWDIPEAADAIEARVAHAAKAVIYSSDIMAARAKAEFGPRVNAEVAPFGINFEALPTTSPAKPWPNRLELLFVCTDWERKGGDLAVRVLEQLRARGVDVHLTLVGRLPTHFQNHPNITCAGFLNKNRPTEAARLSRLYSRAHLLLLPSRGDCTPMVVAEAMAHGAPVIASETGGLPAMIPPDTGKIMRQDAAASDWVDAVQRLTADPAGYRETSEAAFAHAHASLTWEKWGEAVVALCRETPVHPRAKAGPQAGQLLAHHL